MDVLLEDQPDLSHNVNGDTALHVACKFGFLDLIESLVKKAPDLVNCKNTWGSSPLDLPVDKARLPQIEVFLNAGADLTAYRSKKNGDSVLHTAVRKRKIELTKLILQKNPDLVNSQDKEGRTALYFACENNDSDTIEALLKAKAEPNLKSRPGPPLLTLLHQDHPSAGGLYLLLEAGAEVEFAGRIQAHLPALYMACLKPNAAELVPLLLNYGAAPKREFQGQTILQLAQAMTGNGSMAALLKSSSVSLSALNIDIP